MDHQEGEKTSPADLLRMTAQVVSAFVRNNNVPAEELNEVIGTVHASLAALSGQEAGTRRPAVNWKKSITPDYLVCLEDGKKLKMLKRHLRSNYDLSPEEYRAKWGLPPDYPMVAPNYAQQRSDFAKKIGLGRSKPRGGGRRLAS